MLPGTFALGVVLGGHPALGRQDCRLRGGGCPLSPLSPLFWGSWGVFQSLHIRREVSTSLLFFLHIFAGLALRRDWRHDALDNALVCQDINVIIQEESVDKAGVGYGTSFITGRQTSIPIPDALCAPPCHRNLKNIAGADVQLHGRIDLRRPTPASFTTLLF